MREDAQQQQERERVCHKYHEISAWVEAWPEDDICAYMQTEGRTYGEIDR